MEDILDHGMSIQHSLVPRHHLNSHKRCKSHLSVSNSARYPFQYSEGSKRGGEKKSTSLSWGFKHQSRGKHRIGIHLVCNERTADFGHAGISANAWETLMNSIMKHMCWSQGKGISLYPGKLTLPAPAKALAAAYGRQLQMRRCSFTILGSSSSSSS